MRGFPARVHCSVPTTGTGIITLGAPLAGKQSIPAGYDGAEIDYAIVDGDAWEEGRGTYDHGAGTLTRAVVASSSGGSAINLTGAASMFSTIASATMEALLATDVVDVPYDAANFFVGGGDLEWQVSAGNVVTNQYRYLVPNLMLWTVSLSGTHLADITLSGLTAPSLFIVIPDGKEMVGAFTGLMRYRRRSGVSFSAPEFGSATFASGLVTLQRLSDDFAVAAGLSGLYFDFQALLSVRDI